MNRFILCVFLFSFISVKAQREWWPIQPHLTTYFSPISNSFHTNGNISLYVRDSIASGDTIRYFLNKNILHNLLQNPMLCDLHTSRGWAGPYQDILGDSLAIVYNENNTPLYFNLHSNVGDTMIFRDSIIGRGEPIVTKLFIIHNQDTLTDLFGTIDSVRIFKLETVEEPQTMYGEIKLSKKHGLLRVPNINLLGIYDINNWFYMFPWNSNIALVLNGIEQNNNSPNRNITFDEIYNLQVGDIIHQADTIKLENFSTRKFTYKIRLRIKTLLSKNVFPDSIHFNWDIEEYQSEKSNNTGTISFKESTNSYNWKEVVIKNDALNSLPGDPVLNSELSYFPMTFVLNNKYNVLTKQLAYNLGYKANDSCFYTDPDGPPSTVYTFINGLGGPLIESAYGAFDNNDYSKQEIRYYKKGNIEWGTPFPFTLGTKTVDFFDKYQLYPNPTRSDLNIHNPTGAFTEYGLTDLQGKVLYTSASSDSDVSIPTDLLQNGMYLLQLRTESGYRVKKIQVQH